MKAQVIRRPLELELEFDCSPLTQAPAGPSVCLWCEDETWVLLLSVA